MKEIYILKVDFDGCMKSVDKPIGFAVETEKQAMKFLEFPLGFRRSIQKIKIVDSLSEVLDGLTEKSTNREPIDNSYSNEKLNEQTIRAREKAKEINQANKKFYGKD